jgi:hypothetical protein
MLYCVGDDDDDDDEEEGEEEEKAPSLGKRKAARMNGPKISDANKKLAARPREVSAFLANFSGTAKAAPSTTVGRARVPPTFKKSNKSGRGSSKHENGGRKTDVTSKTAQTRVTAFPGEFKMDGGNIWCLMCKCRVASGASNFAKHRGTAKHQGKMKVCEKRDVNTEELRSTISDYLSTNSTPELGVKGMERVPLNVQTFRADVVESFLKAGVPIAKVDELRGLLEKYSGMPLTHSNNLMSTYMPPLTIKELKKLKEEIKGEVVGCYHDGTTHQGEAFSIVLRWMDATMTIRIRCVSVTILSSSLDASEISGELITAIASKMGLRLIDVLAWMNDAASPNLKAFSAVLSSASPASDQDMCMGHTLSHVGEALVAPHKDKAAKHYIQATSKSPNARCRFREVTDFKCVRSGETRWNSSYDVDKESLYPAHRSGKLVEWVEDLTKLGWCKKSMEKMGALLRDPRKSTLLEVELATLTVGCADIYKLTTMIQGDGLEYCTSYEQMEKLRRTLKDPMSEALEIELTRIAGRAPAIPLKSPTASEKAASSSSPSSSSEPRAGHLNHLPTLKAYALRMIEPASVYLEEHLNGRDSAQMDRMRAASFFDPLSTTPPSEAGVDELTSLFRFFQKHPNFKSLSPGMKKEISMYRTLKDAIPPLAVRKDKNDKDTFDIVAWWVKASEKLPNMALALRGVATHSPNSAPPERVFSILSNSFGENQTTSLCDYVELSLMLQFNMRGRKRGE